MITYEPGDWGVRFIFRINGSVLPRALVWGVTSAAATILLNLFTYGWYSVDGVGVLWGGYTTVLGFLVVFRNNEAYGRFWEGTALMYQVRGEWLNAGSSLIAFCSAKADRRTEVIQFQEVLMRLLSMLHCSALQMIAEVSDDTFEIISPIGMDPERVRFLMRSDRRTEIAVQWIQRSVVEASRSGVLDIPPPILSRVFQELSRGIVNLHNVRKIKEVPLPFPYAQTMSGMMLVHWIMTPIIASQSMDSPVLAGILALGIQTAFWSIIYIAREIEQPFGDDNNDLPMPDMQIEFNDSLELLLQESVQIAPTFLNLHEENTSEKASVSHRGRCSFGENHMEHAISSHRLSATPEQSGGGFFGARGISPATIPSMGQMFGTRRKSNAGHLTPETRMRSPAGKRMDSPQVIGSNIEPQAVLPTFAEALAEVKKKSPPARQAEAPGDIEEQLQMPTQQTPSFCFGSGHSSPDGHCKGAAADELFEPRRHPPDRHDSSPSLSDVTLAMQNRNRAVTASFGSEGFGSCRSTSPQSPSASADFEALRKGLNATDAEQFHLELAALPGPAGSLPIEDELAEVPGAKHTLIESPSRSSRNKAAAGESFGAVDARSPGPKIRSPGPKIDLEVDAVEEILSEDQSRNAANSKTEKFLEAMRAPPGKKTML